ncbi:MAG: GTPase [Candidatus Woesearchaeota archaeon]
MGFSDLPPIERVEVYLDTAFRKARLNARKHVLADHEKSVLNREKSLALIKIDTVRSHITSSFQKIIAAYPNFDNLTEFYTQLLHLTLDYNTLKKSLGSFKWVVDQTHSFSKEFARKIKRTSDAQKAAQLLKQYYGRVSSVLKQIKKELVYLNSAREVLRTFPSLKQDTFTVAIAGFPNVGKSTLLSQITPAKPQIHSYAFTTKGLNQGYAKKNGLDIQFIDTPGTLNRLEKMNTVEKIAYLALRYAADYVVYVFDITQASYPLADQQKLFKQLKKSAKPIVCYLSKTDLLSDAQIEGFESLFSQKKILLFTDRDALIDYLWNNYSL